MLQKRGLNHNRKLQCEKPTARVHRAFRATERATRTVYVEGRQELARAITLDEKRYKDAMEHYVKAIEYHIAGYKRDSVVSHKAKVYQNIQSYIERAEVVSLRIVSESDRQLRKVLKCASTGRRGSERHSDDSSQRCNFV